MIYDMQAWAPKQNVRHIPELVEKANRYRNKTQKTNQGGNVTHLGMEGFFDWFTKKEEKKTEGQKPDHIVVSAGEVERVLAEASKKVSEGKEYLIRSSYLRGCGTPENALKSLANLEKVAHGLPKRSAELYAQLEELHSLLDSALGGGEGIPEKAEALAKKIKDLKAYFPFLESKKLGDHEREDKHRLSFEYLDPEGGFKVGVEMPVTTDLDEFKTNWVIILMSSFDSACLNLILEVQKQDAEQGFKIGAQELQSLISTLSKMHKGVVEITARETSGLQVNLQKKADQLYERYSDMDANEDERYTRFGKSGSEHSGVDLDEIGQILYCFNEYYCWSMDSFAENLLDVYLDVVAHVANAVK